MKRYVYSTKILESSAAFRRLCVETSVKAFPSKDSKQPPSGGCVLKLSPCAFFENQRAAAFRRLCVETGNKKISLGDKDAAAFRRLCVETLKVFPN